MRNIAVLMITIALFAACKKDTTTTPANNNNNNTGCGDGNICFNLDGTDITKQAGGYELADTFLFVKYEEGANQLSIDIFGKNTGAYTVTHKRKVGNARIYYFKGNNNMYMAETGTLNISTYDASGKTLSGTFSATLYKYDNTNESFNKTDSLVIKNGTFTKVSVPK